MAELKPPPAPVQPPDPERGRGMRASDIMKFATALLASFGVGSAINFFKRRSTMRHAEQEQQRQAAQADELERMRAVGHETSDVRLRVVLVLAGGMIGAVAVVSVALYLLSNYFSAREQRADVPLSPIATAEQLPPEPRLQVNPSADWEQLRATDEAQLSSYGWVDRGAGALRIPVDRAMDLITQRGLPARSGGTRDQAYDQAHQLESSGGQPPGGLPTSQPAGQSAGTAPAQPTAAASAQPSASAGTTGTTGGDAAGAQLFVSLACSSCHLDAGNGTGPALRGVFGKPVQLQDGTTATADEAYIRESILNPTAKIVAGYQPVMPSFQGRVSEAELAQLVAYIKSLGS